MKRLTTTFLAVLAVLAFPTVAFADVAGVGTIIVFGLLPYVLIAAVVIVAAVILIRAIKRRNK